MVDILMSQTGSEGSAFMETASGENAAALILHKHVAVAILLNAVKPWTSFAEYLDFPCVSFAHRSYALQVGSMAFKDGVN